jgi:hypothetical protein
MNILEAWQEQGGVQKKVDRCFRDTSELISLGVGGKGGALFYMQEIMGNVVLQNLEEDFEVEIERRHGGQLRIMHKQRTQLDRMAIYNERLQILFRGGASMDLSFEGYLKSGLEDWKCGLTAGVLGQVVSEVHGGRYRQDRQELKVRHGLNGESQLAQRNSANTPMRLHLDSLKPLLAIAFKEINVAYESITSDQKSELAALKINSQNLLARLVL